MNRPITTLFMIESLDGKISTGDNDLMDVDKDFKKINGVMEGLPQYYELEKRTDLVSLNSGKVMAKIGVNTKTTEPNKMAVSFIIIDNKPHLDEKGVEYLAKWVKTLYLVTTNKEHPVFKISENYSNIEIISYENEVDLVDLMDKMKQKYGIERLTIQSGGTLNTQWVRKGLIDHVSIVIAPCLIGGEDTPSLMDGESLHTEAELKYIKALKMTKCEPLKDNFLLVEYDVIKEN